MALDLVVRAGPLSLRLRPSNRAPRIARFAPESFAPQTRCSTRGTHWSFTQQEFPPGFPRLCPLLCPRAPDTAHQEPTGANMSLGAKFVRTLIDQPFRSGCVDTQNLAPSGRGGAIPPPGTTFART